MIALLLALAPVAYWHPELAPCVERKLPKVECRFRTDPIPEWSDYTKLHVDCPHGLDTCMKDGEPAIDVSGLWGDHCTAAEQIRKTGEPLECGTGTREDSYCIWRSDGTVEAKNAICSDRKGERQ